MTILVNSIDRTSLIDLRGLQVQQILGVQRDVASFTYKKYGSRSWVPAMLDTVLISDDDGAIFGGRIVSINYTLVGNPDGVIYEISCADYSYDLDSLLVSQTYTSTTVEAVIADILANYATGFTGTNVSCGIPIVKMVFNQVPVSQCLKRLADYAKFDWYVDPTKDLHFFSKYTNLAPYNLTDTSGNYVNKTLKLVGDGTQIANQVKVRGGLYNASTYSDSRTIKGSATNSLTLPYRFANLTVTVNAVSKTIGIDGIDDFSTKQVLYNYDQAMIRVQSNWNDGDVIAFSGNPKVRVLAVASDAASIATYGTREKIIQDDTIDDVDTARKRAIAELATYKDQLYEASFETYTAGLRTGMLINVASTLRGQDVDFLIKSVRFMPRLYNTFSYKVELVSVKSYTLTDILSKLLQPKDIQADDTEISEVIKTDLADITITETITNSTGDAKNDTATITITEVVAYDPLGAHVAPTWVLGPYIPSSTTDTKRPIILNRPSAELY